MEYVLKTHELTKNYGMKKAVNGVSISIKKGDIYGFIGKNGAGKTTLMRLVLGAAVPSSGTLELFGGQNPDAARHRIGSLLESPSLYKNCSAYENLKRFSLLTGNSDKDIRAILRFVELGDTGKKKVGQFSLGMKQRLGIAIAMLGHPEFLILDEPVNGLDPEGIKDIRDLILRLNKELGVTILVSSHLLDELAKVVTVYGIINNGVLVEQISAKELQQKCRRRLLITVDDTEKALEVIRGQLGDIKPRLEENTIVIDSHLEDSAAINTALVENGISVIELQRQTATLESYFMERVGG